MLQEFKKFALRGNVVDLAVGVIIGAAFGKIVDSLVTDIIMPVIGRLTAASSQAATYDAAKKAGAAVGYGQFITIAVNFLIVAWVIFLMVKAINRLSAEEQNAPPPPKPPSREEELLAEIRDLLKARA